MIKTSVSLNLAGNKALLLSSPVFSFVCSSLFSVEMSLSVFSSAGSSALVFSTIAVDWGLLNVGLWSRTQHPCWKHKYPSTCLVTAELSHKSSRSIHFGDVAETNVRTTWPKRDWPWRNIAAYKLGNTSTSFLRSRYGKSDDQTADLSVRFL